MLFTLMDEIAGYMMTNPTDIDLIVVANSQAVDADKLLPYVKKKYPWMKFSLLQYNSGSRSYGALARFGIAYSQSRYVVLFSSNGYDDINTISKMLSEIRKGAQLIQANRYPAGNKAENVLMRFKLYQSVYRFMTKVMLGFSIKDSTYGFKMFDRVFLQSLGLSQNGFSLSPEVTFKTLLAGGKVSYIVSSSKNPPISNEFKLYKEGIGYVWLLIRGCIHRIGVLWF